jgi:hypothetical protein
MKIFHFFSYTKDLFLIFNFPPFGFFFFNFMFFSRSFSIFFIEGSFVIGENIDNVLVV